ncbi:hypothetical protein OG21DRAFT_1527554 [Imleria badia]|nr:hypothetical protein OG21DRAFT_1527554 [Imleria badia]
MPTSPAKQLRKLGRSKRHPQSVSSEEPSPEDFKSRQRVVRGISDCTQIFSPSAETTSESFPRLDWRLPYIVLEFDNHQVLVDAMGGDLANPAFTSLHYRHPIEAFELLKVIVLARSFLASVNNPFIVQLKFSLQNPDRVYLVMSFVDGGELFYHLQRESKFDRDHRPTSTPGLCKLNMSEAKRTYQYSVPELLGSQGYTGTVDWWTLGVLLYEMMVTTLESMLDVANFDPDFTSGEAQDSVEDSHLSETVQDQFKGLTYKPASEHLSESVNDSHVMG